MVLRFDCMHANKKTIIGYLGALVAGQAVALPVDVVADSAVVAVAAPLAVLVIAPGRTGVRAHRTLQHTRRDLLGDCRTVSTFFGPKLHSLKGTQD